MVGANWFHLDVAKDVEYARQKNIKLFMYSNVQKQSKSPNSGSTLELSSSGIYEEVTFEVTLIWFYNSWMNFIYFCAQWSHPSFKCKFDFSIQHMN